MSKPANPLDKFRSYAYHHIVVATESTESIRDLVSAESTGFKNLKLGQKGGSDGSPYYLVFDTRKNSFFSITDVNYTSTAFANSMRFSNAVVSSIDMQIIDSTGVTLINYLRWLQDTALKVSLHKMIFVLKTIFVGHTHDGTTETVYQDSIPMMLVDIVLNPSARGAQITAKFLPITNGAVFYTDDYARSYDVPGVFSETGLLKDAVKSLEKIMNQKSRKWFQDLQLQLMNDYKTEDAVPAKGYGKLVQYMFTVPDNWSSFKVNGVFEDIPESKYGKGNTRENVNTKGVRIGFQVSPTTDVVDLLEQILKQSDEVQKLAGNDNRKEGIVKAYKIYPTITSDDTTVVIHYDILNFAVPKKEEDSSKKDNHDSVSKSKSILPSSEDDKNVMVFDYIFTGKNMDILNFDMKINRVNVAIADNIAIGDKTAQEAGKNQESKETDETKTDKKKIILNLKPKDPILPPAKTLSQHKNVAWSTETDVRKETVKNRQQFIHNMSMVYAASSQDIIIKIRGNPNLFQRFNDATLMPHVKAIDNTQLTDTAYLSGKKFIETKNDNFQSSDITAYKEALNERVKQLGVAGFSQSENTATLVPFFIKINIKGENVDLIAENFDPSFKPYENFWYDGYYIVKKIVHHFQGGEFIQELLIGAVPDDLFGQTTSDKSKVKENTDVKPEVKPDPPKAATPAPEAAKVEKPAETSKIPSLTGAQNALSKATSMTYNDVMGAKLNLQSRIPK